MGHKERHSASLPPLCVSPGSSRTGLHHLQGCTSQQPWGTLLFIDKSQDSGKKQNLPPSGPGGGTFVSNDACERTGHRCSALLAPFPAGSLPQMPPEFASSPAPLPPAADHRSSRPWPEPVSQRLLGAVGTVNETRRCDLPCQ